MNASLPPVSDSPDLRSPDLGAIEGLAKQCPAERSLEMFRRMCLTRHFDLRARQAQEDGDVACLIYLSVGQEAVAAGVSMAMKGAWVLAQHRGHSAYLAFGGDPVALTDELLGLPTGCCGGLGGSPPINDMANRIIGHNGLVGDQVPVAAGVALGAGGEMVVAFLGDGAAEEDYVLATLGFAASRSLPLLLVCEDNDLSVLTPTRERRSWRLAEVARSFGMNAADIADDPWLVDHWTRDLAERLPALLNVRTCRELWHVGTGSDGDAEWNRAERVRATLGSLGLADRARDIERQTHQFVENLWQERLRKRSGILRESTLPGTTASSSASA